MSALLPKGSRDFGPQEVYRREHLFSILKSVYKLYGYEPLLTPAMENLSVLNGKYGDEGSQLLFKVLNSGDFAKNLPSSSSSKDILPHISEKGLRYDLTVPFARYVATNRHNLTLPFKRYQIQPVWRADRPQKGRYREFYQCDLDVVGSASIINEAELISIGKTVINKLGFNDLLIKVNHRGILQGIAECFGIFEHFTTFCVALDKLEKIGIDKVYNEWVDKSIPKNIADQLKSLFEKDTIELAYLKNLYERNNCQMGLKGIEDVQKLWEYLKYTKYNNQSDATIDSSIIFAPYLARGLSYYTGMIYEAVLPSHPIGTIAAGGRYDNLTSSLGGEQISGVGISFGIERIYDIMVAEKMFEQTDNNSTTVLVHAMDDATIPLCLKLCQKIRAQNINTEFYTINTKLKKVFSYADKKNFKFVIFIGSEELKKNVFSVKNMLDGNQSEMAEQEVILHLLKTLR